ncbi:glucoamylase [Marivirga tractuosa]|uniref:Glycoside hydrolase 15-related protein n=1 Tax=Marivirga tractuosa (strain ATCC 23168 / DSM 4126 / NBRC 15989 / NCIMB 1408 / VKM B-1430 / H-43) TaxID=643867 RepID=E4TN38_MARTH|nr:glycoside hydrolase family 15 protein [Marivirga tractuosa]ADR22452.1 glycoside hydrolase 15-related protein [Marivirga tractuosa DSM 4126]BDD16877.1 glucoamylase [Marivirga tractuosa]
MQERHTYDLGMIGNCAYLALIGKDTDIKWMCMPRFDSSFIFGSLIGGEKGGEFSIKPTSENYKVTQAYIPNTNVLETIVETDEFAYKITDCAPRFRQFDRYYRPQMLIRKIEPLRGLPQLRVVCNPVGDYGQKKLTRERGSSHIRYFGLPETLRLTTNIPINMVMDSSPFVLTKTRYMVMTYGAPLEAELQETAENFISKTIFYWQNWVKSTSIGQHYQEEVIRSSLALKIHQYEDTGGIIASPTMSLPESPGSTRNWDYRYCWMRDTYYTLTAFNNIGHFEEMENYFLYLTNIPMRGKERVQPLYNLVGEGTIIEKELDLPGYMGNQPVRLGNDAYTHIQNDVYGQILLAILPLYTDKRFANMEKSQSSYLLQTILDKIEFTMDEADAGLWEFRNLKQKHAYTHLFQWAGSHAAMKIAREIGEIELGRKAEKLLKQAAAHLEKCYAPNRKAYAQAEGVDRMDASTLQLIMMNYIPHDSQKAKDHLKALEEDLRVGKGLFYRYKHADDFGEPETTFLICAFWYVEALACVGRTEEAMEAFEELVGYSNHVGLLSEDVKSSDGSMWGNFPQAYSHVGLVNAAYRINNKLDKPDFLP